MSSASDAPAVLVVDADVATRDLLAEWLAADGLRVVVDGAAEPDAGTDCALAVVAVPYPRDGRVEALRDLAAAHPGVPVLALSPTFFGNVECTGPCARALGVAGVLARPVSREALIATVRKLLSAGP